MSSAVVFAYHNVGVQCLKVLLAQGMNIPLVFTHDDDPGERIWFDSVAALAREHGIETIMPADPNVPEFVARVRALAPDFLFSFYYRRMLSPAMLAATRRGAFNMHGSLLPKYRGRVPVNWAVIRGETSTGATLHEMVEKPDAGRIVGQQAVSIGEDETAFDVFNKVTTAAAALLARELPRLIGGTATLAAQDLASGSYFGGRRPEDGRIDWLQPAKAIHDLVRGVAPPYPGAFTVFAGRRVRVLRTRLAKDRAARPGGTGLYCEAGALYADCADGTVLALLETENAPGCAELGNKKIPFDLDGGP